MPSGPAARRIKRCVAGSRAEQTASYMRG